MALPAVQLGSSEVHAHKSWYPDPGAFCLQPTVLNPAFDEECRIHAGEAYKQAGVKLQLNVSPTKFEKGSDGKITVTVEPKEGEAYQIGGVDVVLLATGRQPHTNDLGLEEVGPPPAAAVKLGCAWAGASWTHAVHSEPMRTSECCCSGSPPPS